jgi:TolB-like protein
VNYGIIFHKNILRSFVGGLIMKKVLFCIFTLFACAGLFAQQFTVAVSPFEARGGLSQDEADGITELYVAELVKDKTIRVVDRNNFDKIMTEMKFQSSDWADSRRVAELGRAMGANSIIRGTVMNLAGQTVITSTILDINTAQILSSSTLRMANIREVFDKLPEFVNDMVKNLPRVYKIGDKGPGGGTIFFAEGGTYMECSGELGQINWNQAVAIASNYRGGGFTNWHLPDRRELDLMYKNLKQKNLGDLKNEFYWSSAQRERDGIYDWAWCQYFWDGDINDGSKVYDNLYVRAVRSFNQ